MVRNEKRGGGTDYQRRKCAGDAARQPGTGNMPSHVNLQCLETNGTMWRWFQRAELTGLEGTTRDHGSELVALDRPLIALYKPVRFLSLHSALAEVRGREFGWDLACKVHVRGSGYKFLAPRFTGVGAILPVTTQAPP